MISTCRASCESPSRLKGSSRRFEVASCHARRGSAGRQAAVITAASRTRSRANDLTIHQNQVLDPLSGPISCTKP